MRSAFLLTITGLALTAVGAKAWADGPTQRCYNMGTACTAFTCYRAGFPGSTEGSCTHSPGITLAYDAITQNFVQFGSCEDGGSGCVTMGRSCNIKYYYIGISGLTCDDTTQVCTDSGNVTGC